MQRLLGVVLVVTNVILFSLFPIGFAILLDQRCGMSVMSPRISGGNDAELKSKPWMVYLHDSNNAFICGGSLIHPWFILTAAHCFGVIYNNKKIYARLGEHNSKTPWDCNYYECADLPSEYLVTKGIKHPSYRNPRKYDIALGQLNRQVRYTDSIRPICIAWGRGFQSYVNSCKTFFVSGWGATRFASESSILQTVELKQVDRYQCHHRHGYDVDETHICAGDSKHYVGRGDSGSPLGIMMNDNNGDKKFVQFGIVSHHRNPYNGVSVFTNVLPYANWIRQVVNSHKTH